VPVVAREAPAGRELELPVVQAARQHAVVDLAAAAIDPRLRASAA